MQCRINKKGRRRLKKSCLKNQLRMSHTGGGWVRVTKSRTKSHLHLFFFMAFLRSQIMSIVNKSLLEKYIITKLQRKNNFVMESKIIMICMYTHQIWSIFKDSLVTMTNLLLKLVVFLQICCLVYLFTWIYVSFKNICNIVVVEQIFVLSSPINFQLKTWMRSNFF